MKIVITPNYTREGTQEVTQRVVEIIKECESECEIIDLSKTSLECELNYKPDLIIFIGGDGTMLRSGKLSLKLNAPMMGINTGNVGYHVGMNKESFEARLRKALKEGFKADECVVINAKAGDRCMSAINDVVLYSEALKVFSVYKNEKLIYESRASGIIFSTPVGSTGINISSGGAILENTLKVFEITPICPYAKEKSSLVVDSFGEYRVSFNGSVNLSYDGEKSFEVKEDILIGLEESFLRLVK